MVGIMFLVYHFFEVISCNRIVNCAYSRVTPGVLFTGGIMLFTYLRSSPSSPRFLVELLLEVAKPFGADGEQPLTWGASGTLLKC
jgi:hypothetical protein